MNVSPAARPPSISSPLSIIVVAVRRGTRPRPRARDHRERAHAGYPAEHRQLRAPRPIGINVAIDDFGTGYSSLSLPCDACRSTAQDRPLVRRRHDQPAGLVHRLHHHLARAFPQPASRGRGCRNRDQATFLLRVLNCDEIQGYLIARPMPVEQLERRLEGLVAEPILGRARASAEPARRRQVALRHVSCAQSL